MKVKIKFSFLLLVLFFVASNIYAFEKNSSGNWSGESIISIYCDMTEIDYNLDKLAEFLARIKAADEVAELYYKSWNIDRDEVKSLIFSQIYSDVKTFSGNYREGRVDFKISLSLDKYNIENAAQLFRFDVEKRLLYILPLSKMNALYLKSERYREVADIFMTADDAENLCGTAANILRYSELCRYITEDPFGMLGFASLTNVLMGDEFPEFYFFDGVLNFVDGNFVYADEDFEKFLEYHPKDVPAILYRAVISEQLGTGMAEEYLNMAADFNAGDEISLILSANVNKLFWNTDAAKSYYKKAAEKYPSNYLPYMFLGEYEFNAGNLQGALQLFQKSYESGGSESFHAAALKEAIDSVKSQL